MIFFYDHPSNFLKRLVKKKFDDYLYLLFVSTFTSLKDLRKNVVDYFKTIFFKFANFIRINEILNLQV